MSETRITNSVTGGEKGQKRARFDLVPVGPLTQVAEHYGIGAEKYDDRNWERGYDWSLSYAAALRHLTQFWSGEDDDVENGSPHLAAVIFHCMSMMEWRRTHPELDDRPDTDPPVAPAIKYTPLHIVPRAHQNESGGWRSPFEHTLQRLPVNQNEVWGRTTHSYGEKEAC